MGRKTTNVLWFTNGPLEPLKNSLGLGSGGTGYWMTALLEELNSFIDIKITVVTVYPNTGISTSIDGVDYYLISQKRSRILPVFENQYIPQCLELINKIKPDLIHIHGTERFYGMLREHITDIPIIIAMQGLIGPSSEWFNYYGNINLKEIIRMETVRRFLNGSSPFRGYLYLKQRSKNEIKILQCNSYFVGRTDWDKAYVTSQNKHASYYSISEILRKNFYNHTWNIKDAQRHRIFISNCRGLRSGADLMLKAFPIIKKYYPDATLFVAGSDLKEKNNYQRYLSRLAQPYTKSCCFTGYLKPDELIDQCCRAHVFVHPTYIDNSPNSLAEAQVVGVPCVASCTGGKMSMVAHGKTGLLFPNGDKYLLADRVIQLFKSDELTEEMGKNAMKVARSRHNPDSIVEDYIKLYREVSKD